MDLSTAPAAAEDGHPGADLGRLARARRAGARAEFALWSEIICYRDEAHAELAVSQPSGHRTGAGQAEVVLDIAQTLGLSELSVEIIVATADAVRRRLPGLWRAFGAGEVDAVRVRVINQVLSRSRTDALVELLDGRAVGYAAEHTTSELRAWLKRCQARLEPETSEQAAESARAQRRVEVVHGEDSMSWLNAYLPTPVAAAVERRLAAAAKALSKVDPLTGELDERTLPQKQADLVCHWLTSCTGTQTDLRAEVAISISAADLSGHTDGPGTIRGLGLPVPAAWVRELACSETTLFRRLVLDDLGRVMDTSSLGYQPAGSLRGALQWRDGCCRVAGCLVPAERADLDHQHLWQRGGPTTARNLLTLCRRHHRPPICYREPPAAEPLPRRRVRLDVGYLHAA